MRDRLWAFLSVMHGRRQDDPATWKSLEGSTWGHPLVTFPDPGREWAIPATGWHVDSHQWSTGEMPGLVAFTFLDEVLPRGGGTLVMPGSHRVTWQLCQRAGGFMRTGDMKSVLAGEYTWFAGLWREPVVADSGQLRRYFDDGAVVKGTHVRVAELCGQAGDVVLMNPRVLHAAAPNVLTAPRMMLSDFIT